MTKFRPQLEIAAIKGHSFIATAVQLKENSTKANMQDR